MKNYLAFLFIMTLNLLAEDTSCNRVAYVNYQKILVDSSSTIKGIGLKYLLDKDPIAKSYLETYQQNSLPSWKNAFVNTLGVSLALVGIFTDGDSGITHKNVLIGTGLGVLVTNFILTRKKSRDNEENLIRSIREYNKRHTPKIYFSPENQTSMKDWRFGIQFARSF